MLIYPPGYVFLPKTAVHFLCKENSRISLLSVVPDTGIVFINEQNISNLTTFFVSFFIERTIFYWTKNLIEQSYSKKTNDIYRKWTMILETNELKFLLNDWKPPRWNESLTNDERTYWKKRICSSFSRYWREREKIKWLNLFNFHLIKCHFSTSLN